MPTDTILAQFDGDGGTNQIRSGEPEQIEVNPPIVTVSFSNDLSRRAIITFDLNSISGLPVEFNVNSATLRLDVTFTPGPNRFIYFEIIDRDNHDVSGVSWLRFRFTPPNLWDTPGGDVFPFGPVSSSDVQVEARGPETTGTWDVDITSIIAYAVLQGFRRIGVRVRLTEVANPVPENILDGFGGTGGIGKILSFSGRDLIGTPFGPRLILDWSDTELVLIGPPQNLAVQLFPTAVAADLVLPLQNLTCSVFGPSIDSGVPIDFLTASVTVLAPSVSTGGITVTTDLLPLIKVSTRPPIVVQDVLLGLQTLAVSLQTPTVSVGGSSVQTDLLSSSLTLLAPSVTATSAVSLEVLDLTLSGLSTSIAQDNADSVKVNFV